ncbi:hypothetical protein WN48_00830 [Eufriesea mexicana]|nr:hypothetical protein WN48_00830 [Eufriesea mexicana]
MTALRGNLRNGMPELDIPSIEPLKINEMKIIDEPQIKITAKDIKLNGLWTFHLNFLHLDLEKKELTADFAFDKITLDADFLLKLNILVPIQRKGVMVLKCNNAGAKIKAYYKLIKRDNEQYVHFESIPIKLDIKDYTADFKTENLDSSLQSAINDVLGKNHDDVLRTIQPHVEKAISKSLPEVRECDRSYCVVISRGLALWNLLEFIENFNDFLLKFVISDGNFRSHHAGIVMQLSRWPEGPKAIAVATPLKLLPTIIPRTDSTALWALVKRNRLRTFQGSLIQEA